MAPCATIACSVVFLACVQRPAGAVAPKVTQSIPAAGAKQVDPKTREIKVTYDQPMDTERGWSILAGGVLGPKIVGRPRWEGDRTLVLRVQIEPDHRYALAFNNQGDATNIRNKQDEAATPYTLIFTTAAAPGQTASGPPHVTKSAPANDAKDVNPSTREIRLTFDQPTAPHSQSLVGGGPQFPAITGDSKWTDGDRTVIIPVKLEPDHEYQLSVNSPRFDGFMNKRGIPAVPFPLHFRTGKAAATSQSTGESDATASEKPGANAGTPKNALSVEQNRESIQILKEAIDEDYSYRDRTHIDWAKQFARFSPDMEKAPTPLAFATLVAKLLEPADDLHLSIEAEGRHLYSWNGTVPPANFNFATLSRVVPGWTEHGKLVATGLFPGGAEYVLIRLWDAERGGDLAAAYGAVAKADRARGLIIDVRPNGGGDEPTAAKFAGCFVDSPRIYGKNENRFAGKFHGPYDRVLQPNTDAPHFRGKVAVLMGPRCVSSNESFLLMMKTVSGCKLIGEHSRGASGNPKPVRLANDVTVYLSSWRDLSPDGTCFEGVGIAPDIEVRTKPPDFAEHDPVLEAAVRYLSASSGAH